MKRKLFLLSILLLSVYSIVLKGQGSSFKKDSLQFEVFKQKNKETTRYEITEDSVLFNNAIQLIETDLKKEQRILKKSVKKVVKDAFQAYLTNLEDVILLRSELDSLYNYIRSIDSVLAIEYRQNSFITDRQYKKRKKDLGIKNAYKQYLRQNRKLTAKERFIPLNSETLNKIFSSEKNWQGEPVYSEFIGYLDKGLQKIRDDKKEKIKISIDGFKQNLQKQIDSIAAEKDTLIFEKELLNNNLNKRVDSLSHIFGKSINDNKSLEIEIKEKELALINGKKEIRQTIADLETIKSQLKNKGIQLQKYVCTADSLYKESRQLTTEKDSLERSIEILKEEEKHQLVINKALIEKEQEFWLEKVQKVESWLKIFAGLLLLGILALSISFNKIKKINKKLTKKTKLLKESHKELNHRVKNNLQTISSLIYLKGDEIEDKKSLEVFESLQGKIEAMKIIHQKLYREGNKHLTKVNIAEYIRILIEYVVDDDADVQLDLQELFVEIDHATDIGLMLNELITNAAKYAFPNTVNPKLSVQINAEEEMLNLLIKDNGVGFPKEFSIKQTNSYGLKSIRNLVQTTERGILDIFNDNGANIFISMPFNKKEGKLII